MIKPASQSFPEIFRKHFGDSFILLTRDEVLSGKLFGIGKNHECLESMIGDYVAKIPLIVIET